jgi:hypothetical protein
MLMRRLLQLAALLVPLAATTAIATGPTVYATKPWLVWRETGVSIPFCVARLENAPGLFQLMGAKQGAGLSVAMPTWNFSRHTGSLMLIVDDAGMGTSRDAVYEGPVIQLRGPTDAIYLIMRGIDVPGGDKLEVRGDRPDIVATFDIPGYDPALKAWKACVDGL